jgi:hypothetical protein
LIISKVNGSISRREEATDRGVTKIVSFTWLALVRNATWGCDNDRVSH